jgi:hypothetical protein
VNECEWSDAVEFTYESIEQDLIKDQKRHDRMQRRRYLQGEWLRYIAWAAGLIASVIVVLGADKTWARIASIFPIIASSIISLEVVNPLIARSGWHYRYRNNIDRLLLELVPREKILLKYKKRGLI